MQSSEDEDERSHDTAARVESGSRRRRSLTGRFTESGCIVPNKPPRQNDDGHYIRPQGRTPFNMDWDHLKGLWTPTEDANSFSSEDEDEYGDEDSSHDHDSGATTELEGGSFFKKQNPGSKHTASSDSSDDEEGYFHPNSDYQEPDRLDELTLFELHRRPRPLLTGRIQRSLKALNAEFRCAICLDYIRSTRTVVECLHRFCEDCIERSLRMGRNECPICRAAVPSKRSLAADPDFDRIVNSILGDHVFAEDQDGEEEEDSKPAAVEKSTLQQAIHRKRSERALQTDDSREEQKDEAPRQITKSCSHSIVGLELIRARGETRVDSLELPFLRLSGEATIALLHEFLKQKLEKIDEIFEIVSTRGQVILQEEWSLETVSKTRSLHKRPDRDYLKLYFRLKAKRIRRSEED